jgi:predicted RNA binding protein YcfA (HicA-like mRNA interferase family)
MSKKEKLVERIKRLPSDFTWQELITLLSHFGFEEVRKGKTSGSRRAFVNAEKKIIRLHEPHPGNILKPYQLKEVIEFLGL